MAEKCLYLPYIDSLHQKMCSEAVPQGMDGRVFHNTGLLHCGTYSILDALVANVVAPDLAASGVHRQTYRGKNILPFPFFCRTGIFFCKGAWELHLTKSCCQVFFVQGLYL